MKAVKSFSDKEKKKGKIGSLVLILKETMYFKLGEKKEVRQIESHGGNGTYLKFEDGFTLATIKATDVEIIE